jgi:hypothetical protein
MVVFEFHSDLVRAGLEAGEKIGAVFVGNGSQSRPDQFDVGSRQRDIIRRVFDGSLQGPGRGRQRWP